MVMQRFAMKRSSSAHFFRPATLPTAGRFSLKGKKKIVMKPAVEIFLLISILLTMVFVYLKTKPQGV